MSGNPISIGSGSSITVSPLATTTYFVRAEGSCNLTNAVSITISVNAPSVAPVNASSSTSVFCNGSVPATISLTAIGGSVGIGATVNWYTGGCGGTLIGSGSPLVILPPSTTTTYYVSYNGVCNTTSCVSTTVTVETSSIAATSISPSQNPICIPDSTTLTVVGGSLGIGANWVWYISGNPISIGSGSSITVSPVAITTYFVRAEGSCNLTNAVSITISVRAPSVAPVLATTSATNYCSNSAPATITLTASGGSLGSSAIINWYSGGCGIGLVGTGSPLTIPAPITTTTYFVSYDGFCNSTSCVSVTVNVNEISIAPLSILSSDNNYCVNNIPSTITLSTNGGNIGTGAVVNWYDNSCGVGLIGNISPLTVPAPLVNTTYYVNYSGLCNTTACTSININVLPVTLATINPVIGTICQNGPAFNCSSLNPGGVWSGIGITDSILGTFNPSVAGSGIHQIIYTITGSCGDSDTININVNPSVVVNINSVSPLCLLDTAIIIGVNQPGGLWSGTGITNASNGIFDPVVSGVGVFQIIYTIAGICPSADSISIVVDLNHDATISPISNFCISDIATNLIAAENGGNWSGVGITDAINGTFNPSVAGAGTHQVIYTFPGSCYAADTVDIIVNPLLIPNIDLQTALCKFDSAVTLTVSQPGGSWSGNGIIDSVLGIFDPSIAGVGIHQIIYSLSSFCSGNDTILIVVDSSFDATINPVGLFCINDTSINLSSVQNGGIWLGNGIIDSILGTFNPKIAGIGLHQIIYTFSGNCGDADTIQISVNPIQSVIINPIPVLCDGGSPFNITATINGGTWFGAGITDSINGIFDPFIAGIGIHQVIYSLSGLCGGKDTVQISVVPPSDATIDSVGLICSNSGVLFLTAASPNGIWSGPGIIDSLTGAFDPNVAGIGLNEIVYTASPCNNSDTLNILVNLSANAQINNIGSICINDSVFNFTAAQIGGIWSGNGIIDSLTGMFNPLIAGIGTDTIVYTISGQCGDSDTLFVSVTDVLDATIENVDQICINKLPFSFSSITPGGIWFGNGIIDSLTGIFDPAIAGIGIHQITYTINGSCGASDTALIEVFDVPALIITSTDETCNGADDGVVNLVITGGQFPYNISWSNGSSLDSLTNLSPGSYGVSISDFNGCQSFDSVYIQGSLVNCDQYIPHVYVPNIFSPNGDNVNDILFVRGKGILKLSFVLYDRWGEKVFETSDLNIGWDGNFRGKVIDSSVFIYYLNAELDNGEKVNLKGNVTLVR